jgi:hypothetical protein
VHSCTSKYLTTTLLPNGIFLQSKGAGGRERKKKNKVGDMEVPLLIN